MFLIYLPYLLLFFPHQDNNLTLGSKATDEKCCGRNPRLSRCSRSSCQPQLGLSRGLSTGRWQHCRGGSWLASKAARAGAAGGDLSWVLLGDGAGDEGCKYYWRTWQGPEAWLTGSNKKGMFLCVLDGLSTTDRIARASTAHPICAAGLQLVVVRLQGLSFSACWL